MSNKKEEANQRKMNQASAAHMLMIEFVKREADHIARALESIIPLEAEVSYESLEQGMGVVNHTFASIALQLIAHNSLLDPNDPDKMVLPVGAKTMNDTIEEMSKFIHSVRTLLWVIQEKFQYDPAIKLAGEAFYEYQPQM